MARIAGVDLPRNKQVRISLTYIFGIGNARAKKTLEAAKVDPFKKTSDLTEDETNRIRQVIEAGSDVEGDLRKDVSMHIKRLIEIQCYRGLRHRRGLPTRGQRTRTNARTRKGPRKGTVTTRKKATAKT
jgi:small subunit ribosomal protein S13